MVSMFVRHKVEDYARWKRGYDDADWLRKQHGITYASVHRDETDPTTIIVVHQFKDMNEAKKFVSALPPIMEKAGVVGRPDIWFSEDVERVSYSQVS
jgi:quinol monooxygenase YgiN